MTSTHTISVSTQDLQHAELDEKDNISGFSLTDFFFILTISSSIYSNCCVIFFSFHLHIKIYKHS